MTFLEAQELTSDWLDDKENGYFDLPTLKMRINLAQIELQKELIRFHEGYYRKCVETSLVPGQTYYKLPEDFIGLERLSVVTSGSGSTRKEHKLDPITLNQQDLVMQNQRGTPVHYYFENNHLIVLPPPDIAKTLVLTYIYRVQDLVNDGDEFDAPIHYHEFIPVLAARDGFIKDGRDLGPINDKLSLYRDTLKKDAEQRRRDNPRMVVTTALGPGSF